MIFYGFASGNGVAGGLESDLRPCLFPRWNHGGVDPRGPQDLRLPGGQWQGALRARGTPSHTLVCRLAPPPQHQTPRLRVSRGSHYCVAVGGKDLFKSFLS